METQTHVKVCEGDSGYDSVEERYSKFVLDLTASAKSSAQREHSFLEHFIDVYSGPESIDLFEPKTGIEGRLQDVSNISVYFRKAIGHLNLR